MSSPSFYADRDQFKRGVFQPRAARSFDPNTASAAELEQGLLWRRPPGSGQASWVACFEWHAPPRTGSPGYIYQTNINNFPVSPDNRFIARSNMSTATRRVPSISPVKPPASISPSRWRRRRRLRHSANRRYREFGEHQRQGADSGHDRRRHGDDRFRRLTIPAVGRQKILGYAARPPSASSTSGSRPSSR